MPTETKKEAIGLYLHVPFCQSKCPYCDFYSLGDVRSLEDPRLEQYTTALCHAIETAPPTAGEKVDSVYFGGGTPLLLGPERIGRILQAVGNRFTLLSPEITLEANPHLPGNLPLDDILLRLGETGVNRLSFGVQSGVGERLRMLGRIHDAPQAAHAVQAARAAGFQNLSLDLMLGLPGQTVEELEESLTFCTDLAPEHLSAYILKVEAGTPFAGRYGPQSVDEDLQADLYLWLVERLEERGYHQYEISNFAKPGAESRHNLKYWRCQEYLGVGPAAASFLAGERFAFPRDLPAFLAAPQVWTLTESEGPGGGLWEEILLGLRLSEGLDLLDLAHRYGEEAAASLRLRAAPLEKGGFIIRRGERLALTPRGMLMSNSVSAILLP